MVQDTECAPHDWICDKSMSCRSNFPGYHSRISFLDLFSGFISWICSPNLFPVFVRSDQEGAAPLLPWLSSTRVRQLLDLEEINFNIFLKIQLFIYLTFYYYNYFIFLSCNLIYFYELWILLEVRRLTFADRKVWMTKTSG